MSEREREAPRAEVPPSADSLPALIGRLGEDLTMLVDSKLTLLKIEVKEDLLSYIRAYIRGGIRVGVGGLVAAVGFGLVSAAAALMVSTLLGKAVDLSLRAAYSLGFVAVGVLLMIGGLVGAGRAAHRLGATEMVPEQSIRELEKDREWLRPGSS